jgi:hypothetical protein
MRRARMLRFVQVIVRLLIYLVHKARLNQMHRATVTVGVTVMLRAVGIGLWKVSMTGSLCQIVGAILSV